MEIIKFNFYLILFFMRHADFNNGFLSSCFESSGEFWSTSKLLNLEYWHRLFLYHMMQVIMHS